MSKLVTISLDEESYVLWQRLDEKSRWVRQRLHEQLFDEDLVKHTQSEAARADGIWDGLCNPNHYNKGICANCWSPERLSALSVNPTTKMYLPSSPTPPKSGKYPWSESTKKEEGIEGGK